MSMGAVHDIRNLLIHSIEPLLDCKPFTMSLSNRHWRVCQEHTSAERIKPTFLIANPINESTLLIPFKQSMMTRNSRLHQQQMCRSRMIVLSPLLPVLLLLPLAPLPPCEARTLTER